MEKDLKYYAKVHSVESFGTVDGPGIRFVLFLQGCHLQCKYCHNRDTWDMNGGEYKSVDEIIEKINRYKNYMMPSGGGVTVTGGEPLLQHNFVLELFKRLKEEGIPTCVDTSGMVALTDGIKEVLKYTDLVLLDIKHIDEEKCKELVGFSNKRELEFARYLSDNNIKMVKHLSKDEFLILQELCRTAKKLTNQAIYQIRQHYFEHSQYLPYEKNYAILKTSENYRLLNSNMAQQILKEVDGAFKSFFSLLKLAKQGKYPFSSFSLA